MERPLPALPVVLSLNLPVGGPVGAGRPPSLCLFLAGPVGAGRPSRRLTFSPPGFCQVPLGEALRRGVRGEGAPVLRVQRAPQGDRSVPNPRRPELRGWAEEVVLVPAHREARPVTGAPCASPTPRSGGPPFPQLGPRIPFRDPNPTPGGFSGRGSPPVHPPHQDPPGRPACAQGGPASTGWEDVWRVPALLLEGGGAGSRRLQGGVVGRRPLQPFSLPPLGGTPSRVPPRLSPGVQRGPGGPLPSVRTVRASLRPTAATLTSALATRPRVQFQKGPLGSRSPCMVAEPVSCSQF